PPRTTYHGNGHTHTHTHTKTGSHTHRQTLSLSHTHQHSLIHTWPLPCSRHNITVHDHYASEYTHIDSLSLSHTHTHTHTHTRTYTHIQIHTCIFPSKTTPCWCLAHKVMFNQSDSVALGPMMHFSSTQLPLF